MHEIHNLPVRPGFCLNACGVFIPEVALGGFDGADGGVLFIGVAGAKISSLTGKVFKLHAHTHRVSMGLCDCRHGAFNDIICFPVKLGA